jgi:anti-anti-sigma factor
MRIGNRFYTNGEVGMTAVEIQESIDEITLQLKGRFNITNCTILREALEQAIAKKQDRIMIDCRDLLEIDSSAIAELVKTTRSVIGKKKLLLRGVNNEIMKTFKVVGLHTFFKMV